MRIAYVLTQDLESPSGVGRYLPLARQLVQRGHEVHIGALHPDFECLESQRQRIDGVEVNYVAPMHVQKQGNLKTYYGPVKLLAISLRATIGLSGDCWRSDAPIIHVGKPHPMNSIAGLVGGLRASRFLCLDCDDYEAGSMHFTSAWQKALISLFERRMPNLANLVTVNTHFMQQKLIEWGVNEKKILFLPNGVEQERFTRLEPEKVEQLRQELDLTGKRVIAYIGSLSLDSHPVDLLMCAFAAVLAQCPEAVLLVVGGGSDYFALVELAKEMSLGGAVIFTGRVPPAEVPLYYRLADVSVDPVDDNEAARGRSPLKLFESWASSVPFITSRVGDRTQLLETSQAGVLTADCSPEAYAAAILEVLYSPSLAEALRLRGEIEVQNYTWEKLTDRLEQAYQTLLAGDPQHGGRMGVT